MMKSKDQRGKGLLGRRYADSQSSYRQLNPLQHNIKEHIESKIRDQIYTFEYIDCPVCDQSQFASLSRFDRYGLRHDVVICTSCGLIMANPRMTQDAYSTFYHAEYRPLYHGDVDYPEKAIQDEISRGKLVYAYLNNSEILSRLKQDDLIVEVGCGAGGILKVFADHGYDVMGIDIGEPYLSYGRDKYGLNLQVGWLDTVQFERPPSLIIYSHVMEHILDVAAEIEQLKQTMADDGCLYIEVPGVRYLHRSDYDFMDTLQNAHVYYFTRSSLCNLLQRNGMELICGDEYIRSVFRQAPQTQAVTPPDNSFPSTMAYLRRMEWQRTFMPISPYVLARRLKARLFSP